MTSNPSSSSRHRLLKWFALAAVIVALLAVALPLGALKYSEHHIMSQMSPAQQTEFKQWCTKQTSITDDEIRLQPFSDPMVEAMDDFVEAWQNYKPQAVEFDKAWQDTAYNNSAAIRDEFLTTNREALAALAQYMETFSRVVHQPDYSIEAWEALMPGFLVENNYLKRIRSATRLLYARAIMNARAGNNDLAIEDADTLVAYGTMTPYNSLLHKMIGMAGVEYGLEVYQELLARGLTPRDEQIVFDKLWARLPSIKFYPDASQDPIILDHVGITATARRAGMTVRFENLTGQEIMVEAMRVKRNYLAQVVLPATESQKLREQVQAEIAGIDESLQDFTNRDSLLGAYHNSVEQVTAATVWMNSAPAMKRASDNARETFEDYNTMLKTLSRAAQ